MAASEKMAGESRVGTEDTIARSAQRRLSPGSFLPIPPQSLPLPLGQGPGPLVLHQAGPGAPQVLYEGAGEATAGPWDQGSQWTGAICS